MARPEKIKVYAYTNKEFTERDGDFPEFTIPVNPEQFSQRFKVRSDQRQASGSQGNDDRFLASAPEELKLDFPLDGTKTIMGYAYPDMSVPDQVDLMVNVMYSFNGEIHQPKFLKVNRGKGIGTFNCKLVDLQITYTLFKPDGEPLRAKISATFKGYTEPRRRTAEQGNSSPDLTHLREAKEGDHLSLMVYRIYKDPAYYLEVAKANGLTNFRRLKPGQEIIFPPVEKTS